MDPRRVPGGTARDVLFGHLLQDPKDLLREAIFPDDSYEGETYWADLPTGQRTKWILTQHSEELGSEIRSMWKDFQEDPFKPMSKYFHDHVVTGLGFLSEGYVLFSVGNVLTLFEVVWPQCYKTYQIVGIILGQVMIGIVGDWIGRRWGIIQDATTMFIGAVLLTGMWGAGGSLYGWTVMYALSLLVFGTGVGGEYPMTSITAMEGVHGQGSSRNDKLHRGRGVLLAFLMQGWGQLLNQAILIILLLIFSSGGSPPFSQNAAIETFRVSFAISALFLLGLIYIRVFKLKNVDQTSKASKKRSNVTGYDTESLRLVFRHYWHRLLATSLCWFCNDFPFYGNQIFRNVFLQLVTSSSSDVRTIWLYNMINVGCELVGYYLAAMLIDHKLYGRKRMQATGFIMSFLLFIIAASIFPMLNKKGSGAHAFEAIYFVSSFWIQFGPNSTTFLIAGEVYPGPVRATAHGMSAAVGKLGALTATVLYNYIGSRTKFWVVSWFGLIGFTLTVIFVPDTTGLDLREQERYWQYVREGRPNEYHGVAIHPRHLSLFERLVLKRDRNYNPELDKDGKVEELREMYKQSKGRDGAESEKDEGEGIDEKVSTYFDWESSKDSE